MTDRSCVCGDGDACAPLLHRRKIGDGGGDDDVLVRDLRDRRRLDRRRSHRLVGGRCRNSEE